VQAVASLRDLRLTKAAELVEIGTREHDAFAEARWRSISTTKPLERILREIRQGSRSRDSPMGNRR
jgi:hypothetical protein